MDSAETIKLIIAREPARSSRGKEHNLAWYTGTSDSSIRDTIKDALGIPPESNVILHDEDGVFVAINQFLPNNFKYFAEERNSNNEIFPQSGGNNRKGASTANGCGNDTSSSSSSNAFRGELLKFERINAHLANERTWLAWVRTALSALSCAFAFLSISATGTFEWLTYALGCLFCVAVIVIYGTGWLRYLRVKQILGLSFNEIKNKFERIGVHWVAYLLGGLFVSTVVLYWIGVFLVVQDT